MVVRIVGGEQVVCDCQGDTPDKYLDKLLVGIIESKNRVTVSVICSERDFSMRHEVASRWVLEFGPDCQTLTE